MITEKISKSFLICSVLMASGTFVALQAASNHPFGFRDIFTFQFFVIYSILSFGYLVVYFTFGLVFIHAVRNTKFDRWWYYLLAGALTGRVMHFALGYLPNPDGGISPGESAQYMRNIFSVICALSGVLFCAVLRAPSNKNSKNGRLRRHLN